MRSLDVFWAKVDVAGPNECWPWNAGRYPDDYGMLGGRKPDGKSFTMRAHAFALMLASGEFSGGRYALHTCDNPPCCNPAHLYWGDQKRNIKDMDDRGRGQRPVRPGSSNGRAKLTDKDVEHLRAAYRTGLVTQQALAEHFAVSQPTVSQIVRSDTWR